MTAVGGTSLGIGKNGQRVVETGWETTKSTLSNGSWGPAAYLYGSGGGTGACSPSRATSVASSRTRSRG